MCIFWIKIQIILIRINNENKEYNILNSEKNIQEINITENTSKKTNKNILKKVCTILSIIVAIYGFIIGISYISDSFSMDSIEFFGPLLNIFLFFGGIAFFIYTGTIIATIWIIYGIIKFISKFYNKLDIGKKILFILILIVVVILILIAYFS